MTFATDYQSIIVPRLRPRCRAEALCLTLGTQGFEDAVAHVWAVARKYGAAFLPFGLDAELREWIADQILLAAVEADEMFERPDWSIRLQAFIGGIDDVS